jgi:hypothetical protein
MALTKSFKELVQGRMARDPAFADALLREGIDTMLTGDVDTGKALLRDYIKATVGFEKLGEATDTPPKSLIRMFGPRGNPQARNLFGIIGYLQKQAGVQLHVTPEPR